MTSREQAQARRDIVLRTAAGRKPFAADEPRNGSADGP